MQSILVWPCVPQEIGGLITEEKGENRHWKALISLPHARIPKGGHNVQMAFCKIINWRSPALGRLSSFVFISSLAQTCLPLPFPVFVCEALCSSEPTAWQAHSTESLGAGFGYSGMSLILPASTQLQASGSFGKIIDL